MENRAPSSAAQVTFPEVKTHKYQMGIVGNCSFLALVGMDTNVEWLCWPRFDSSFVFGGLLDKEKGGAFSITPEHGIQASSQRYLENTNVLETHVTAADGRYKVVDFAPRFNQYERYYKPLMLVRKIQPLEGQPRIQVCCRPVGHYGAKEPGHVFGSNHIRYTGLDSPTRLTTDIPLSYVESGQAFVLNETRYMVLTYGEPLEAPLGSTAETFLEKTTRYWLKWVRNTSTEHFHQDAVIRSALTLKLHQYQDTGAIIASATTSLPESPGSGRNWDYRFCWLRDAHYTLKALNDLSHFGILRDYANFVENIAMSEDRRYHPLYPIINHGVPEEEILQLSGYLGETPVRVGNQAYEHIQNDVYGQVLVTLLPFFTDKRLVAGYSSSLIKVTQHCLRMIEVTMEEPDNGIWEFRGLRQLHAYTFLFHWAGSQAALRIAKVIRNEAMAAKAEQMISRSTEMIEKCYDPERKVYTQAAGNPNLDASLLQLINMGYLEPESERAKCHLQGLEKDLKAEHGLFYRYRHADDFGAPESTFLICAFWYVEALARVGRVGEAVDNFESLLGYANHLGLLSEDIEHATGSQWGNFPQTYSHVGLINAAFYISRKLDKPIYF